MTEPKPVKPVKIVPNGDRYSYELPDRSALVGIFTTFEDACTAARLAGYHPLLPVVSGLAT